MGVGCNPLWKREKKENSLGGRAGQRGFPLGPAQPGEERWGSGVGARTRGAVLATGPGSLPGDPLPSGGRTAPRPAPRPAPAPTLLTPDLKYRLPLPPPSGLQA